ncbi:MAG TPA: MFS transporter [Labilithrix sp.]|nr:MFS transporter [Labilithrix sp.]
MKASTKVGLVLLVSYLVAWLDRMAINMAVPFMAKDLAVNADKIGWILSAFFAGYALCQIPGGLLADKLGPRKVILIALAWWTVFTLLTGVVTGLTVLLVTRFLFGVGEGLFPASVWKVIGQWFTKKNRATANALILSSIAIGPAVTPILLAPVLQHYGWRTAFYVLGGIGLLAFALAHRFIHDSVRSYPGASRAEIAQFERDEASELAKADAGAEGKRDPVSFRDLLGLRAVWALFFTALAGNITMYGWLNWLPSYLMKVKGLDLKGMALAASLPFAFGAVGLMASGWVSDRWFRGHRKVLVLACQVLGGLALFGFTRVDGTAGFMVMQCIAGFLLFMAVGAIWAMPMVLLPPRLMGSGSGFINMGGQIGGFLTNIIIVYVITWSNGSYAAGFNVLFGGLVVGAGCMLFGVREAAARPAASRRLAVT